MNTMTCTRKGGERTLEVKQPTPEEPLEVVIDRQLWYRGEGAAESRLLNYYGKMCCLGFDALACGLDRESIVGRHTPMSTGFEIPGLAEGSMGDITNTGICRDMMSINDDSEMKDEVREEKLANLAAQINRKFVFKG